MRAASGLAALGAMLLTPALLSAPASASVSTAAEAPPRPKTRCDSDTLPHAGNRKLGVRVCWTVRTQINADGTRSHNGTVQVFIRNLSRGGINVAATLEVYVGRNAHTVGSCGEFLGPRELKVCRASYQGSLPSGALTAAGLGVSAAEIDFQQSLSPFIRIPEDPQTPGGH